MKEVTKISDRDVTETCDRLEKLYTQLEELKILENSPQIRGTYRDLFPFSNTSRSTCFSIYSKRDTIEVRIRVLKMILHSILTSLVSLEEESLRIGGRRVADAIVVSAVSLLSIVYLYLVGCIDRGGSKAGSSGSLDFRDIYISIVLFQAAYVWIKFRDVNPSIPIGAVYGRPRSSKWEARIKFPVTRGSGDKSKRIPLGLFDTSAEAEVAYRIAAFYCKKRKHRLGRLDLGGDAYFPIPTLSVDPNLPYEEKVEQVGDQVLRVYAEFEEQKASMNLPPPRVPGLALEMPTGEGQLLPTAPSQQRRQPFNSGMEPAMRGEGSQPDPIIHDFNNPGSLLPVLCKTQSDLLEANKEIKRLNDQVSEMRAKMEVENMRWEVKYSELERKCSELERKNEQWIDEIMQSQLQPFHQEPNFGPDMFLNMGYEESLPR